MDYYEGEEEKRRRKAAVCGREEGERERGRAE